MWLGGESLPQGHLRAFDAESLERGLTQVPMQDRDWNFVGVSLRRGC